MALFVSLLVTQVTKTHLMTTRNSVPQKNYLGKSRPIFEKYLLCKIFSKSILNIQDKNTSEKYIKSQDTK